MFDERLGERLIMLRKEKGVRQEDVADYLNIARPTYTQYETNRRKPDIETLRRIADYFHCSLDFLLGRTDDPKPPGEDNSTEIDLEEIMKKEGIMFDGIPLDEEDKEDILEVMKIAWKTIQKRKQK